MILFEFILIILTPVVCSFGLVTNILVIIVVTQNKKELKETQYKFMSLNALSNSFILFIKLISLISECQRFNGIYCSQFTKYPVVQYFKIIFQEYISSFLFLFSSVFISLFFACSKVTRDSLSISSGGLSAILFLFCKNE